MVLGDRQKVLIFRPTLAQGGADRVTLTLLQHLDRSVVEPILVLVKKQGEFVEDVPADVPVMELGAGSLWTAWRPLMTLLQDVQPDVLFSTCSGANMPAALAHLLTRHKSRLVLSERNVLIHGKLTASRMVQLLVKRLLYPHANLVTAVSQGVKDDLIGKLGLLPENIKVVYNPVVTSDMKKMAEAPVAHVWFQEDIPIVLAVARLVHQKDYPALLKAIAQVRRQRPVRLFVLGEGPLRSTLEVLATELDIAEDVCFAGFDKNPFRYMDKATIYVLSSRQEGLPGGLIQAMACGLPAVSTNCPAGPSEIITHGEDGFLVPVGDVNQMAHYINVLLDDRQKLAAMGHSACLAMQRFSVSAAMARYTNALLDSKKVLY